MSFLIANFAKPTLLSGSEDFMSRLNDQALRPGEDMLQAPDHLLEPRSIDLECDLHPLRLQALGPFPVEPHCYMIPV